MAMTLRTGPAEETALTKLAAHWRVSKQAAALRAITLAAEQVDLDILQVSDELAGQYADALDRLGRS
jgi:Zn-dependent peptidase ImmA (M78 family)